MKETIKKGEKDNTYERCGERLSHTLHLQLTNAASSDLIWIKGPCLQRELMFPSGVEHVRRVLLHLKSPLVRLWHVKSAGANASHVDFYALLGSCYPGGRL